MTDDSGRVGFAETGSRPSDQAPAGLDASRFDPAREVLLVEGIYDDGEREPHTCEQVGVFSDVAAIERYMNARFQVPRTTIRVTRGGDDESPHWSLTFADGSDLNIVFVVCRLDFNPSGLED